MQRVQAFIISAAMCGAALSTPAWAEQPGFVSSERLQGAGYSLDVNKLSKRVLIRSVKSSQLTAGQPCEVNLQSVRNAIGKDIAANPSKWANSADKPEEAFVFLKGGVRNGTLYCEGEGDTCTIVVTVPPKAALVN